MKQNPASAHPYERRNPGLTSIPVQASGLLLSSPAQIPQLMRSQSWVPTFAWCRGAASKQGKVRGLLPALVRDAGGK